MEDKTAITLKKIELAWALALDVTTTINRDVRPERALSHFKTIYEGISAVVDGNDAPQADGE